MATEKTKPEKKPMPIVDMRVLGTVLEASRVSSARWSAESRPPNMYAWVERPMKKDTAGGHPEDDSKLVQTQVEDCLSPRTRQTMHMPRNAESVKMTVTYC